MDAAERRITLGLMISGLIEFTIYADVPQVTGSLSRHDVPLRFSAMSWPMSDENKPTIQPVQSPTSEADVAAFVDRWFAQYGLRIVSNYARAGAPFYLLAALCCRWIVPPDLVVGGTLSLAAIGTESVLWQLLERVVSERLLGRLVIVQAYVANLFILLGMSVFLYGTARNEQTSSVQLILVGMIWGASSWTTGIFTPVLGNRVISLFLVCFLVVLAVLHAAGIQQLPTLAVVAMLGVVTVALFFMAEYVRLIEQARLQKKMADLEGSHQRLRLKAIDTEIRLASELQLALPKPPEQMRFGRYLIDFFAVQYSNLGGDWLASRDIGSDGVLIAVGDVSGKGVPAAMVLQAVQSLWAAQLDAEFSPIAWLTMVNDTLLDMGYTPGGQSMTLGLLLLRPDKIEYFSAGHVPLIFLRGIGSDVRVEMVAGQGAPLGILANPDIRSVTVELVDHQPYQLMLGTCGIFDWHTRKRFKRVLALAEAVNRDGIHALREHPGQGDKILVIVRDSPAQVA